MAAVLVVEAELVEAELIAKARLYADRFCPGWSVGSIALWVPGRRKPRQTVFFPDSQADGVVTAEGLKDLMRVWASAGRDWRACSVAFSVSGAGDLPQETLVVRSPATAAAA